MALYILSLVDCGIRWIRKQGRNGGLRVWETVETLAAADLLLFFHCLRNSEYARKIYTNGKRTGSQLPSDVQVDHQCLFIANILQPISM